MIHMKLFNPPYIHFHSPDTTTTTTTPAEPPVTASVPKKFAPIQGYISTLHRCHLGPEKCFDGNKATMCKSQDEDAPWLAFEFQAHINVSSVIIYNPPVHGNRTANVELWMTDTLPAIGETMFTGGHLIGNFTGPGKDGEKILIETDPSKSGRYLLIQMDKRGLARSLRPLNLLDVEVFTGTSETGESLPNQLFILYKYEDCIH